jgi:transposase InsO family protein
LAEGKSKAQAARDAGYSESVSRNPKRSIEGPNVREQFEQIARWLGRPGAGRPSHRRRAERDRDEGPYGNGCGTVFKITPSRTLTVLHSFAGNDGSSPYAGGVQGTDGDFYGAAVLVNAARIAS